MNKIFIAIAVLIGIQMSVKAQIYVGGKVGIAPSMMLMQKNPNHKSSPKILNMLAGVMVEVPIVGGFSIQPELQFVQKGTNLKPRKGDKAKIVIPAGTYYSDYSIDQEVRAENNDNGLADEKERYTLPDLYENIKINLNYLESQILFKYEFVGGGSGLYVELGPYFAYGLSSKGTGTLVDSKKKKNSEAELIQNDGTTTDNYTDLVKSSNYTSLKLDFKPFKGDRQEFHYKKFDLGAVVGGGLYKDLGESRLYFDLRLLYGLSNINKVKNSSAKVRNVGAQLSITYLFPLGG